MSVQVLFVNLDITDIYEKNFDPGFIYNVCSIVFLPGNGFRAHDNCRKKNHAS